MPLGHTLGRDLGAEAFVSGLLFSLSMIHTFKKFSDLVWSVQIWCFCKGCREFLLFLLKSFLILDLIWSCEQVKEQSVTVTGIEWINLYLNVLFCHRCSFHYFVTDGKLYSYYLVTVGIIIPSYMIVAGIVQGSYTPGKCQGILVIPLVWLDDMYLMPPGLPTDIGLQLGKACCPCSR